jgi:hypothetical protein
MNVPMSGISQKEMRMAEKKKAEAPVLAVTSRVKDYIKAKGMRSDGDLDTAINEMIAAKLDRAVARCKGNGRQTVRPDDI